MPRTYKLLLATISAVTTAMLIGGTSAADATTHPSSLAPAANSGTEHFHMMTTSATSTKNSLIATGVFTAGGMDIPGNKADTVQLPGGTFKVNHPKPGTGTRTLNPKTCLLTASLTGPYTLSGGTGSYAGISGSGKARISILAIAARNSAGKCSMTLPPVAWQQTITGTGPVHL